MRMRWITSTPESRGMRRSIRVMLGWHLRNCVMASTPSAGFANDFDSVNYVEKGDESLAHDVMIFNDENANGFLSRHQTPSRLSCACFFWCRSLAGARWCRLLVRS